MIALSMDGPTVNWNVLNLMNDMRRIKELPTIADIGLCTLHIVHGAFKTGFKKGASNWNVQGILGAMYRILKDSPARRDQYEKCSNKNDDTDQPTYPLPFFTVRWVENKPVAARALDCWSNFKAYMRWWETQPPSKKPKTIPPLTHSCSITQMPSLWLEFNSSMTLLKY